MRERTALYRVYDTSDALLYVGISTDPERRWSEHAGEKSWWEREAVRQTVEWYSTRAEAGRAESVAVRTEAPRRNRVVPAADGSSSFRLITPRPCRTKAPRRAPRRKAKLPSGARGFAATDDLWQRFGDAVEGSADAEADMSKVLRAFVRWYVHEAGAKLPDRPVAGPWSKPAPAPSATEES
ncbi:GIY-YIG nuclease family protein [Actinacidiphila sp. ITFR-21]|uniref:GIY-YIG nuclease family protein n=1 Tax=Actinacidiphila sp. ITFR-21 TaxID=3075199 RepID=UPI0037DA5522